jgi:hypothetical protein
MCRLSREASAVVRGVAILVCQQVLEEMEKEWILRSTPLPLHERGFSLAFALRNYFVQLEDSHEHRDNDSTDDHTEKHDQERLISEVKRFELLN